MGRSQETFNKKEVRNKKEKKRKEKAKKRLAKKEGEKSSMDDMIAYVDENGMITSTPPDPAKKKEIKPENIEIGVPKSGSADLDPIRKGTVNYFDESKGYGFIQDSETKESVFVHVKNSLDEIKAGSSVIFEVEMGDKGPIATNVKLNK